MRIVFNSDVLHARPLAKGRLTRTLENLCRVCREEGHTLVLPTTTHYELQRFVNTEVASARTGLRAALERLDEHEVEHEEVDPDTLIGSPNIVEILSSTGVRVNVEEPKLEDYQDANRRASLHLPPHPINAKSDEMRDLVIWAVALRVARQDGEAILVSRDKVHTGLLGQDEAAGYRLKVCESIDDAANEMNERSPARRTVEHLLEAVWIDLTRTSLPIPEHAKDLDIEDIRFVRGEGGLTGARFSVATNTPGDRQLRAQFEIAMEHNRIVNVCISDVALNGTSDPELDQTIATDQPYEETGEDHAERLMSLKELLGGNP